MKHRSYVAVIILMAIILFIVLTKMVDHPNIQFVTQWIEYLQKWTNHNQLITAITFFSLQVITLFFWLPFFSFLCILCGALIEPYCAISLLITSCVIGHTLSFLSIKHFSNIMKLDKYKGRIQKVAHFFQKNVFLGILILRLLPTPYIISNIAAGFFKVDTFQFILATFIGVIPGILTHVYLGYQITLLTQI